VKGVAEVLEAAGVDLLLLGQPAQVQQVHFFPKVAADATDAVAPGHLAAGLKFRPGEGKGAAATDFPEDLGPAIGGGWPRGVLHGEEVKKSGG